MSNQGNISSGPRRCIVLSPHLDDGVLSCGGLIAKLQDVFEWHVWTVFSTGAWRGPYSPSALWLHGATGIASPLRLYRHRRQEDRAACGLLGARWRHLGFRDAPYRKTRDGNFMYHGHLSVEPHEDDRATVRAIAEILERNIRASDVVMAPLALGTHVDHVLTRQAAELVCQDQICLYTEIPYAIGKDIPSQGGDFETLEYSLSQEDLASWLRAIDCYDTQTPLLGSESACLAEMLSNHASGALSVHGIAGSFGLNILNRACVNET